MRVLLRNTAIGLYYAGDELWASDKRDAVNLRQIEHAIRLNEQENLGATDIILSYDNPPCTVRLPITSDGDTSS